MAADSMVGTGRSADVFAHGADEVLRRYRSPRDTEREVAAMEHARTHGYPVPMARAVSDTEIVMDRLDGPTMLSELGRRPWRIGRHAATLASLQHRLHEIRAPGWLPAPLGDGESLLHLDLHPDNVILTERGPFVIDWPNAARGPGAADVAHTWIVLACSTPTTGVWRQAISNAGRGLFLRSFLRRVDRSAAQGRLNAAGAYRLANRTLPQSELDAIRRLLDQFSYEGPNPSAG
jgi:aminoglycoside phosphotransferase (APT) family kinase protein